MDIFPQFTIFSLKKQHILFKKVRFPDQKNPTCIGQSICDQLQIWYKVVWIVTEGSWAADESWCSTSAKQVMFWRGCNAQCKAKGKWREWIAGLCAVFQLYSYFPPAALWEAFLWDMIIKAEIFFPPNFFHGFFAFAVDPRDQMSHIKERITSLTSLWGRAWGRKGESFFFLK